MPVMRETVLERPGADPSDRVYYTEDQYNTIRNLITPKDGNVGRVLAVARDITTTHAANRQLGLLPGDVLSSLKFEHGYTVLHLAARYLVKDGDDDPIQRKLPIQPLPT